MHITVIIRSIGRDTLARAIASVESQAIGDVEVLVIDALNRGLSRAAAAQAGLDEARGEWALFLDDDDELLPGHLDKLTEAARRNPQAVAVHTGVVQVHAGPNGDLVSGAVFDRAFEPWHLLAANTMPIHAVLFDRRRLQRAGVRFDPQFEIYEDWDFWLQVQRVGPIVHVPGVSARYWIGDPAAHSTASATQHGDHPYLKLWSKWWQAAPSEWWRDLMAWARSSPDTVQVLNADRSALAEQIHTLIGQAQSLSANLQETQASRDQLRGDLERAHTDLHERNLSILALSEQAAKREEALALAHADLHERNLTIHSLHEQVAAGGEALAHSQALVSSLELQLQQTQLHAQTLSQVVQEIRGSTSWRVTAPLRAVMNVWMRLRRPGLWRQAGKAIRQSPVVPAPISQLIAPDPYHAWIQAYESTLASDRQAASASPCFQQAPGASFDGPLVSVVMPLYNAPLEYLQQAVHSLQAQWWGHWQLCAVDDASPNGAAVDWLEAQAKTDPRIRVSRRRTNGHISACSNDALAMATGEWVVLMDQDDTLPEEALWRVVEAAREHPQAALIYSDEDKLNRHGQRCDPYFKPAFNLELLRAQNVFSHLGAFRRTLLEQVGGFRVGFEGSQDHDLVLRCVERVQTSQVVHIPRVLYHWRIHEQSTASAADAKPYALINGLRAVQEHLERTAPGALVQQHPQAHFYRVHYPVPANPPLVDIIIPTRDGHELLARSVNTLLAQTTYAPIRVTIVDNGSVEPATLELLARLQRDHGVRVIRDNRPFNFSALNNGAVAQTDAPLILLLNNDVEIIQPDWLREMVGLVLQPGVGCVGARLWYPDGRLQHGGVIIGQGGVAGHAHLGLTRPDPGYFGRAFLAQDLSAVTAACLLTRREVFDQVQGLDEAALTVAFNDVDFCLKVRAAGHRVVWTPFAELVHHESATRGSDMDGEKRQRFEREIATMMHRWAKCIGNDPAFNPNLALAPHAVGELAHPPRNLSPRCAVVEAG